MPKIIFLLTIVAIVAVVAFMPINLPYNFTANGIIYPAAEWTLISNNDGGFDSKVMDYEKGFTSNAINYRFERGDISKLIFFHNEFGERIKKDDTLGLLFSQMTDQNIENLRQELEVEKANLQNLMTGEKIQIVDNAEKELSYAVQALELQQKEYSRIKDLADKKFAAQQELDRAINNLKLAEINIQIAKTNLDIVTTGEKPEIIELSKSRIARIEENIKLLADRRDNFVLRAPMNGVLVMPMAPEIVFNALDDSFFVVRIPIKYTDREFVDNSCEVIISMPPYSNKYKGTIFRFENKSEIIMNRAVFFAYAKFEDAIPEVRPGALVSCQVSCKNLELKKYLKKLVGLAI